MATTNTQLQNEDVEYYSRFCRDPKEIKIEANPVIALFIAPTFLGSRTEELIVVTSHGGGFGSVIEAWSLDSSRKNWECQIGKPKEIKFKEEPRNVAYDKITDRMTLTFDSTFTGIASTTLNAVRTAAKSIPGSLRLEWFIPYSTDRAYRGMAIDGKNDIIYCCNDRIMQKADIGAFSLQNGQLLPDYVIAKPRNLKDFKPSACALNENGTIMAVVDDYYCQLHLFTRCPDGQNPKYLTTIATKGSMFGLYKRLDRVRNPDGVTFDAFGNILVADSCNFALKIYREQVRNDPKTYRGVWSSRKMTGLPKCGCYAMSELRHHIIFVGTRVRGKRQGLVYFDEFEPETPKK